MSHEKITGETEVTTSELACVLGLNARTIRDLAQLGHLNKVQRGRFLLCESVQRYLSYKSKGDLNADEQELEQQRLASEVRLKKAKADIADMEVMELQSSIHRSEDVAAMTEDLIYEIRGALLALPGRMAVDVASVSAPAEASEIIRREIHKIMRELANYRYDPKKYEERVRDRMDWAERGDDDE